MLVPHNPMLLVMHVDALVLHWGLLEGSLCMAWSHAAQADTAQG